MAAILLYVALVTPKAELRVHFRAFFRGDVLGVGDEWQWFIHGDAPFVT